MLSLYNINFKYLLYILSAICGIEVLSFVAYLVPGFSNVIFFWVSFVFLVIGLIRLEFAFYILLIELFIGSKGYLIYFEGDGLIMPIRIIFWLIFMGLWFSKILVPIIKKEKSYTESILFLKSNYFNYYVVLGLFVVIGIFNGYLNRNTLDDIFFDFNGWLYFLLVFPAYNVLLKKNRLNELALVFASSMLWISFKTYLILYIFSHNFAFLSVVYKWIRTTGVGEITLVQDGFYRIFFQSHVFVLAAFFVVLASFASNVKFEKLKIKTLIGYILVSACLLSVIIITLSRSFWIGLIVGLSVFVYFEVFIFRCTLKEIIVNKVYLILIFVISVLMIVSVMKFPYPQVAGNYSTTNSLVNRAKIQNGEDAVSSRWALLPELWQKIDESVLVGGGFGTTVTYISSDPRVQASSAIGSYTTYAFEWGWLDIWLKIGLFGLLAYLALVGRILIDGLSYIRQHKNSRLVYGLFLSLICVVIVSIFSPYFNHPLGIGLLITITILYDIIIHKV